MNSDTPGREACPHLSRRNTVKTETSAPYRRHILFSGALICTGILSLGVVPPEELEATKPQLEVTQSGGNLILDWSTHPEVFYFMEGSPDLSADSWVTAKLLKDNAQTGSLSLGTSISGSKGFYRLDLEGDPNAARLREDSDGDRISNRDEAEADMDAYVAEVSVDSDLDGIPDYFEFFHFDNLTHDASTIATSGGLTVAEAYANATDPNKTDSDGDGWTDQQEIDWGWDANYDQSRDDDRYTPSGDFDGDGTSNRAEVLNGTDPSDSTDAPDLTAPFINTGELEQDLAREKNLSFTLTSEHNGNYLLLVVVGSEEFPDYTSTASEFNDSIEWVVKVDETEVMTQTVDVNDLHADWTQAEQDGFAYPGFPEGPHQPHIADIQPLSVELGETSTMEIHYESSVTNIGDGALPSTVLIQLLKVDVDIHDENGNPQIATEDDPANVPVNGDFDEEKQVNGRYVLDYEDASLALATDSNDLKTDDLRGCVVDIPGLTDDVWQNTTLKIRKKPGVIDPLTNEEEAGEIRIHAIDGSNNWVEVPLDTDLAPDYYVSTGQYADYDSCWIEGIKDGPITIEVEVVINGGTPILVEKKAMICTEKTQAEWQQEVWDDMQLLYDADLSGFNPNSTFTSNETGLTNLYNYYGETYLRDDNAYLWMGIGKLAGATVYGGLEDAEYGFLPWATDAARAVILAGPPVEIDLEIILVELVNNGNIETSEIRELQSTLMAGAIAIFSDIAWQFKAYHTSGLCALEYAFDNGAALPIDTWRNLADADENSNASGLSVANRDFADREQRVLIAPTWVDLIADGWADIFTYMAKNPTPGSQSFAEYFTANPKSDGTPLLYLNGALVSDFDDRWEWFTQSIFPDWLGKSKSERANLAEESVSSLSGDYRADFFDLITF